MKLLVTLVILMIVAAVVYLRLRPRIRAIRSAMRTMMEQHEEFNREFRRSSDGQSFSRGTLVRCERCGTWIPASRALLDSGSGAAYCNETCVRKRAS